MRRAPADRPAPPDAPQRAANRAAATPSADADATLASGDHPAPASGDHPAPTSGDTPARPRPGARLRADQLLVDRGLAESRTRAQALILAGKVFSGAQRMEKPGQAVAADRPLELRGQDHPWVSRGGVKLDHALRHFGLSPAGRLCLDIGASTGGFTDVLLHHGAAHVVAVDVGHGQLAWKLRNDSRVTVLERVNARYLDAAQLPPGAAPGALVCDASFIGLGTVLPAPLALLAPGAWAVALIKPQFEVGKAIAKGGVVRDAAVHAAVCARIAGWWAALPGWRVQGVEPSPLLGPEGNREFLIAAHRSA
jgi:23S rRNA (cytidine1920-2'-O)/16S rRNA (cytidine1409-2'-O)-methyltransferase